MGNHLKMNEHSFILSELRQEIKEFCQGAAICRLGLQIADQKNRPAMPPASFFAD
jgi:hypothetical protein